MDKRISLEEAVALVPDGANMSFGGFAETNDPLSFVRQMIRAGKKHLEISGMGDAQAVELLCAAGAVDRVRVSNYMARNGRCPCFCRAVEQGSVQTEDYSHFGITNRFFAAAMGIPFMPVGVMIGSDLERVQTFDRGHKIQRMTDPFTGKLCAVVPSLAPDIAVIHAARADREGNAQLYGITSAIEIIARAARRVFVTAEEIVDTEEIRRTNRDTVLPAFFVDHVIHAPYGAYPGGVFSYYDYDIEHLERITAAGRDPAAMAAYLDEWIYSTQNEAGFLRKVGIRRLMDLRADPYSGVGLRNRGCAL
jgi:glutaconate CoA-transferase subunit A